MLSVLTVLSNSNHTKSILVGQASIRPGYETCQILLHKARTRRALLYQLNPPTSKVQIPSSPYSFLPLYWLDLTSSWISEKID